MKVRTNVTLIFWPNAAADELTMMLYAHIIIACIRVESDKHLLNTTLQRFFTPLTVIYHVLLNRTLKARPHCTKIEKGLALYRSRFVVKCLKHFDRIHTTKSKRWFSRECPGINAIHVIFADSASSNRTSSSSLPMLKAYIKSRQSRTAAATALAITSAVLEEELEE